MIKTIFNSYRSNLKLATQCRNYAARKGTREKAKKKKVKVEFKKTEYVPHNLRDSHLSVTRAPSILFIKERGEEPVDDVYFVKKFKRILMPFQEAIEIHREILHPTMFNKPNEPVNLLIGCNMETEKKNKYIDSGTHYIPVAQKLNQDIERKIVYFSKSSEDISLALTNGITLAGGSDLIKEFQSNNHPIQDYNFFLAHPNILPELLTLRAVLKKKFPNLKQGNLNEDLLSMTAKFLHGQEITLNRDDIEKSIGWIELSIGDLNIEINKLEENFKTMINGINKISKNENFILSCRMSTNTSKCKLNIKYENYFSKNSNENKISN